MKQLKISRNGLELASVSLRNPTSTLGRSPNCDGVLRAPGVKGLHFLLEQQGRAGEHWALFDLSDDSGEGVVVSSKKIDFRGFNFEIADSGFAAADKIGGGIQRSVLAAESVQDERRAGMAEAVRIRRDSGAVQEISHLLIPRRQKDKPRRIKPFDEIPFIELVAAHGKVKLNLTPSRGAPEKLQAQKNAQPVELSRTATVEFASGEWVRIECGNDDLYFRWVYRVPTVPVPREVIGHPFLRWGAAVGLGVVLVVIGWMAWRSKQPVPEIIQLPPRVATVNIKEAPPPPPPPPVTPPPIPEQKLKSLEQGAAAPKFVAKARKPAPSKAGLNAPVAPTDVNQLGLLAALKPSAASRGEGVKADQIFDEGIVSEAAAGKTGSLTLKTPPAGSLDLGKKGGSKNPKEDGLQALSTTLSGGSQYAPKQVGPIGRFGADGKNLGTDLETSTTPALTGLEETGGTDVQGGLDRETVRRVIASSRGKIRACYERALLTQPRLAGRVVTSFEITGKGVVLSAALKASTAQSKTLESCLIEVVRTLVFPEAATGASTRVIYPFIFQAREN